MTLIYLLSAFIVIFIISRLMKTNKIDAFTRMLSMLGIGLLLGAASSYIVKSISTDVEKAVVGITASSPMQSSLHSPVVESVCNTDEIAGQDTIIEVGTVVPETEGTPCKLTNLSEIQDDS